MSHGHVGISAAPHSSIPGIPVFEKEDKKSGKRVLSRVQEHQYVRKYKNRYLININVHTVLIFLAHRGIYDVS